MAEAPTNLPGKMLNLTIPDKPELYRSYMAFLEYGGLFAPTTDNFQMGEEVLLAATLPAFNEVKYLRTKVVWINTAATSTGQPQGIGLAFSKDEDSFAVKQTIEDILPGLLLSERTTYTL
ncbi:PilZ domain-containing protein [Snodgrassella gandavensis]|uniref:PilZ domain-containing protein n=1 Tax=Snodgrassella gandavensis TaxID=2946698 RepID=UPI001EF4F0ED|nr:PilZ domain-containing protein [Snodgrassella gandavensis]